MPSESLQRYTIILLQTTPQISLLLYFTCSEAYHIVKNYLIGFLHFPSNVWIGICCLLLYIQKTRFLEQWIIISSCLRLWLLTALLIFLLLTTDFPCKRENCDWENSFWCAPRRKYYYKDSILHQLMKNIRYLRHRNRFPDFTHRLELGICKDIFLKRLLRRSLISGIPCGKNAIDHL